MNRSRRIFWREARATLLLALPIVVGQISQILMGLTDSIMIGRSGTLALAASSFGGGVFNIFFLAGIGLLTPVALFVSRARGAGRTDEAGEFLRHGLMLALVGGALELGLALTLSAHLGWFRQPPTVLAVVNPFFRLISFSILPALIYMALREFAESMGRPWMPMLIMLGGVGLNALLNWVLIYGHLGVPRLGLTGAGISTLTSRTLGAVVLFQWIRADRTLRAAWPRRWLAPWSWPRLKEMLAVGLPVAGSLLFESGAFGASAVMMGWLGAVPLAAHQIAISCAAMTFVTMLGIAIAVGMRLSAAVGAGEPWRLRPIWLGGLGMGVGLAAVFTGVFLVLGRMIAASFVADGAVVEVATTLLAVAAIFQLFDGSQVINTAALRSLPDVKVPALITLFAYWGVALPAGYYLGIHRGWGAVGIWSALAAGLAVAAVFLGVRFLRLTRGIGAEAAARGDAPN